MNALRVAASLVPLLCVATVWAQDVSALFSDVIQPDAVRPADAAVMRRRWVLVAHEKIRDTMSPLAARTAAPPSLTLNLFDDVRIVATLLRVERTATGYVWVGRTPTAESGSVTLAVDGEIMAGSIATRDADFAIRHVGNGVHEIQQVNHSALPPEAPPIVPDLTAAADTGPIAAADDGSLIDVLVVYTPAARAGAGGTSGIHSLIDLGISETNQAYANSGAVQRIRLVHKQEIDYIESTSMSTDLSRLRSTADGYMDAVHALRDTYGADLVHLIEEGQGACGVAYVMTTVSGSFAPWAFGLTDADCVSPNYSFAHEMGHNMGLHHDIYMTGEETGAYAYSRGYVNQATFMGGAPTSSRWRDIMAYNNQCTSAGFNCSRLLYFANPLNTYLGDAMGTASTADAVRSLNETRSTVANFRSSVPPTCTYSVSPTTVSAGAAATSDSVSVTTATGCAWTVTSNSSWITITGGSSGSGSGAVGFSVAANPTSAARSGSLTAADTTVTVNQAAAAIAPTVTTSVATAITTTMATLSGTVNPNGSSATASFQYGPTTGYGASVAATPSPGSGTSPVAVSAEIGGLNCNTLYHFRVVATSSGGTTNGNDQTFTTGSCLAFTDAPLVSGSTRVKAVHITELRSLIDALRARYALPTMTWTDSTITPGVTIVRNAHLTELRDALDAVYTAAARSRPTYTDPVVTPGVFGIRAVHITEIRNAIAAIW